MQLKHYLSIVRRQWLLIIALPLLVALVSLALAVQQPQTYQSSARVIVTQSPRVQADSAEAFPDLNLNHSWISSEFILDDIPQVVSSRAFAEDVTALLAAEDVTIPPEAVQAALYAENLHRSVTIQALTGDPAQAEALVRGAVAALQQHGLEYWSRATATGSGLSVAVIDPARPAEATFSTRQMVVDVALRAFLALVTAIGLAFLIYYLDDTIRSQQQVEEWLDMSVIAVIPKE